MLHTPPKGLIRPISTVYAEPFGGLKQVMVLEGATLGEIVAAHAENLPDRFWEAPYVTVDGEEIPPEVWHTYRPPATRDGMPTIVTLQLALAKGEGQSSKTAIIGLVAAIALTVVTAGIASGALAPVLGSELFGAGKIGASLLAAGVGVGASLALQALSPAPSNNEKKGPKNTKLQAAALSQNVLAPGAPLPRVIGERKVYPPLIMEPFTELIGQDVFVTGVMMKAGPHRMTDWRADGDLLSDRDDIEIEVREGWLDDEPITMQTRSARSRSPQINLSSHTLDSDDEDNVDIENQDNPKRSCPTWHRQLSFYEQDEIWCHFQFPAGLYNSENRNVNFVPIRMRIRPAGTEAWINLPEMHFGNNKMGIVNVGVRLKWSSMPATIPVPKRLGARRAHYSVPTQTVEPYFDGWQADPYFWSGSGSTYLDKNTFGSSGLINIALVDNCFDIYLGDSAWAKGQYEIEVMRGISISDVQFLEDSYRTYNPGSTSDTDVRSLFEYGTKPTTGSMLGSKKWQVANPQFSLIEMVWQQVQCVYNDIHPAPNPGNAVACIRIKNQSISRISCIAGGYTPDWNGEAWEDWKVTPNPAPHYRDVLVSRHNKRPLSRRILDDPGMVAFRQRCIDDSCEVNAVMEGDRIYPILQALAGCGFAGPYTADIYSAVPDFDRDALSPRRTYTARTMSGLKIGKAFPIRVSGFRCQFDNKELDYEPDEIIVMDDFVAGDENGLLEDMEYIGLTTKDEVIRRAKMDLRQLRLRSKTYSYEISRNMIALRKGELVALAHPTIQRRTGFGRLKAIGIEEGSPSTVVSMVLDSRVWVVNEPDIADSADVAEIMDFADVGLHSGIAIVRRDGSTATYEISNPSGWATEVDLVDPVIDDLSIMAGASFSVGTAETVYRRLVIKAMNPGTDLSCSLELVDEANEIFGDGFSTSFDAAAVAGGMPSGWSLDHLS